MRTLNRFFWIGILGVLGCGYGFKNTKNSLFAQENVQKIYVSALVNSTYKAGVENTVYNSLIRALSIQGGITLVQDPESADAILSGNVGTATYVGSAASNVAGLNPSGLANQLNLESKAFVIATEYFATLGASFSLVRVHANGPKQPGVIWSSSFARSQPFPAANQLDIPGTTSALINESEFDRALADLSRKMVDDVSESMLAMF